MSSITMYIVYTSKYHTNNKGVYIIPKKRTSKKTNEHSEHEHLCSNLSYRVGMNPPKISNFELHEPLQKDRNPNPALRFAID